jgi:hypothetical protein
MIYDILIATIVIFLLIIIGEFLFGGPQLHNGPLDETLNIESRNLSTWESDVFGDDKE